MKKLFSMFLVFVVVCVNVITISALNSDSYTELQTSMELVQQYISRIEKINIIASKPIKLYDVFTDQLIAYKFSINSRGYAIINLNNDSINEYSLFSDNPVYDNQISLYYYGGLFNYYEKVGSDIYSVEPSNDLSKKVYTKISNAQKQKISNSYHETVIPVTSIEQLSILKSSSNASFMSRTSTISRQLVTPLCTDWVNGFCGETAIYTMLKYRGLTLDQYTPTFHINSILLSYVALSPPNPGVTLSSLTNGTNRYLQNNGLNPRVSSCSYSFTKIMEQINLDRPLTLGIPGHVETIHGYNKTTYYNQIYYTIYVNDSWGHNNIAISYDNTISPLPPSDLVDHVYYIS